MPLLRVSTEAPPPSRLVPVIGINSNTFVNGVEYHVQTEDLGPRYGHIITQVFRDGGCVVKSVKLDYSQHLDKPNLHAVLARVMKAHHAKLIRSLQRGRLDSIPPCVTMRRSTPEKNVHLDDIARNAGIECPPSGHETEPPTTFRSYGGEAVEGQELKPDSAPRSVANIWDRLVEDAHHERAVVSVTRSQSEPPPSSLAWDRAVEHSRIGKRQIEDMGLSAMPGPAAAAYAEGLTQMRGPDKTLAVISLARAVEIEPTNRQYRAALRDALDWLDEHE